MLASVFKLQVHQSKELQDYMLRVTITHSLHLKRDVAQTDIVNGLLLYNAFTVS